MVRYWRAASRDAKVDAPSMHRNDACRLAVTATIKAIMTCHPVL
jgi:hypothetical protein